MLLEKSLKMRALCPTIQSGSGPPQISESLKMRAPCPAKWSGHRPPHISGSTMWRTLQASRTRYPQPASASCRMAAVDWPVRRTTKCLTRGEPMNRVTSTLCQKTPGAECPPALSCEKAGLGRRARHSSRFSPSPKSRFHIALAFVPPPPRARATSATRISSLPVAQLAPQCGAAGEIGVPNQRSIALVGSVGPKSWRPRQPTVLDASVLAGLAATVLRPIRQRCAGLLEITAGYRGPPVPSLNKKGSTGFFFRSAEPCVDGTAMD